MTFANPALLLAGLLCVGVPILIHILMRRRRKPVSWGAMDWLMQAYRQQRRRMRFEQLLLLALRCLLIALVGVALGKPLLGSRGGANTARPKTLAIVLDTSLASQAITPVGVGGVGGSGGESALERHKQAALAMLDQLDSGRGDRAALVLLSNPASSVVNPASSDIVEVKRLVSEVRATDARADVEGAMEMVQGLVKEDRETGGGGGGGTRDVVVALLSDLREGSVDVSRPWRAAGSVDGMRVVTTGPALEPLANVAITSVEPLSSLVLGTTTDAAGPGATTVALRIGLARWGNNAEQTTTLRAWLSDAARLSGGSVPLIAPANVARSEISWTAGQREASVTISAVLPAMASALAASNASETSELVAIAQIDQDAIPGDNVLGRPLEARTALNVALVGPGSDGAALDRFTPRDWLGLALWPEQTGVLSAAGAPVRTTRLEARDFVGAFGSSADPLAVPGVLRGMAAIAVTEPQLLDSSGWRSLRAASASGAMIMVMPPESEQAQTWTDAMRDALGVPWQLARNTREIPADQGAIAPEALAQGDDDLLNVLRPEFEELTRAVRVTRVLGVEAGLSNAHVLLSLRDGSPILIAARANIASSKAGRSSGVSSGVSSGAGTGAGDGASREVGTGGWVVVWLVAPSLAWTDLPAKPLMVPLLQELVRQGVGRSAPRRDVEAGVLASAVASGRVRGTSDVVELVLGQAWSGANQGEVDNLVSLDRAGAGAGAGVGGAVRSAGLWRTRDASGAAIPGGAIAVNAARGAGNTTPIAKEQIERWIMGGGGGGVGGEHSSGERDERALTFLSAIGRTPRGSFSPQAGVDSGLQIGLEAGLQVSNRDGDGWKWSFWILIGATGIALIEAMLARWFSHAGVRVESGSSLAQAQAPAQTLGKSGAKAGAGAKA